MNKLIIAAVGLVTAMASAQADTLLSQDFSTFSNGNLVGQGGWAQLSSGTSGSLPSGNPIQVNSGTVSLLTAGQDIAVPLSSSVNSGDLTATLSLSLSAAQTAGDYFLAFDTTAAVANYNSRVYAKSSGTGGYYLGLLMGVTGGTVVYGTTELAFGTIYTLTLTHTFVPGALNDTGFLNIDGSSYTGIVNWSGTTAEDAALGAVAFRQGSAGSSATVAITSLSVTGSPVPEPGTVALVGLGLGAVLFGARRRRA